MCYSFCLTYKLDGTHRSATINRPCDLHFSIKLYLSTAYVLELKVFFCPSIMWTCDLDFWPENSNHQLHLVHDIIFTNCFFTKFNCFAIFHFWICSQIMHKDEEWWPINSTSLPSMAFTRCNISIKFEDRTVIRSSVILLQFLITSDHKTGSSNTLHMTQIWRGQPLYKYWLSGLFRFRVGMNRRVDRGMDTWCAICNAASHREGPIINL